METVRDPGREQKMGALARANEVRFAISNLKREVRFGQVSLAVAMERDTAGAMLVGDLLEALPGVGRKRARGILVEASVGPRTYVRELAAHRREQVVAALGKRQPRAKVALTDAQRAALRAVERGSVWRRVTGAWCRFEGVHPCTFESLLARGLVRLTPSGPGRLDAGLTEAGRREL